MNEEKESTTKKNNLYTDKNGNKVLLDSFCAYFDILGFAQKVMSEDLDYFSNYLTVLQNVLEILKEEFDIYGLKGIKSFEFKIFTDNFVIAHPLNEESGEYELGTILHALSIIQYNFVKANIFMRGAISNSFMYMDENIVLGPALVEAYKLESETAFYPRVILSKDVEIILEKHINFYKSKLDAPQITEYLIDVDGFYFINYLYILIGDNFLGEDILIKELTEHKNSIVKSLNENLTNFKVIEKYVWVANYHNFFCDNFILPEYPSIEPIDIRIDDDLYNFIIKKLF